MFCPKCGNDCRDNRFCVRCGAQVQESQTNTYEGKDSYEVPTGKFRASSGYLRLEKYALIIGDRGDLFKKEVTIPYDKLITVLYVRSQTRLGNPGFLIVRWEGNRNKPMPVGLARYGDRTSVSFTQREDLMFYHIYCFLKTVAPYSAQFNMERHTPDNREFDNWVENVDMDAYFERFSPYREIAISKAWKDLGLNYASTAALVEKAFDVRQQELYAREPSKALRDLNRVIVRNAYVSYI